MDESSWHNILTASGAVFSDASAGSPIPSAPAALHFGDARKEYDAARNAGVVFDVNDRTQIECTGKDRATFLHNFCTNDVKRLKPGEGCEAFVTNIKGRVLGHVHLFVEKDSLWIDSVPGSEEPLITHLDRYLITEDLQWHRRSEEFAALFATGPAVKDVLSAGGVAAEWPHPGSHVLASIAGVGSVHIRRVDWFGPHGFLLSTSRTKLTVLWQALLTAGIVPGGSLAFQTLRIESRYPWFGIDMTDDNLAQEVGRTAQTISFTKGCYLGQEPIARLDAMGHVNRQLCGLTFDAGPVPTPGGLVVDPDRKEIGRITSVSQLAADCPPVALGYLRSRFAKPGSRVVAVVDGQDVPATVFA